MDRVPTPSSLSLLSVSAATGLDHGNCISGGSPHVSEFPCNALGVVLTEGEPSHTLPIEKSLGPSGSGGFSLYGPHLTGLLRTHPGTTSSPWRSWGRASWQRPPDSRLLAAFPASEVAAAAMHEGCELRRTALPAQTEAASNDLLQEREGIVRLIDS